jgi:hypothetical protein
VAELSLFTSLSSAGVVLGSDGEGRPDCKRPEEPGLEAWCGELEAGVYGETNRVPNICLAAELDRWPSGSQKPKGRRTRYRMCCGKVACSHPTCSQQFDEDDHKAAEAGPTGRRT